MQSVSPSKKITYRPELDGLRTFAVIAVMIYHAELTINGIPLFQGGFLGVDVFFVLSGFLITSIIRSSLAQNSFNFLEFYWRRAKRIVPALLVVLFFTLIIAQQIYDIVSFEALKESLQRALLFFSNEYYMHQDGYFANNLHETLLHTWSLSVEWQFYILFPFVIYFSHSFFPKYTFSLLLMLMLISFTVSYAALTLFEAVNFAFYSLATRAWEMLMGGLISYINREQLIDRYKDSRLQQAAMGFSMFFMCFMMLFIDNNIPQPSFSLIVVLATCGYILFAQRGELVSDIFSLKPIVFLGTLSYSMYLWHQPLYVFFRKVKYDQIRNEQFLLLLIITILLSYLSYKFVETPFRQKIKTKMALVVLLLTVGGVFGLNQTLQVADIIPKEDISFGGGEVKNAEGKNCHSLIETGKYCQSNPNAQTRLIVLGDSFAGMFLKEIDDYYTLNKKVNWIDLTAGGTYPFYNFWHSTDGYYKVVERRLFHLSKALKSLYSSDLSNTTIFYSQYIRGQLLLETEQMSLIEKKEMIRKDLQALQRKVKKIIIMYDSPSYPHIVKEEATKEMTKFFLAYKKKNHYRKLEFTMPLKEYNEQTRDSREVLDTIKGDNIIRIYPKDVLCDDKLCYAKKKGKGIFTYDGHHLSITGAHEVFELVKPHLPKY